MKQFKVIDFWGGLVLVVAALVCIPISPSVAFCIGYFGVGSWHIISMLVHIFNKWFIDKRYARSNYHWTVLVIIILAIIGILIKPVLWFLMIVMLFAGPIMIIIYSNICYAEIQKLKRPLALLK
jgi:hypothetical protein